MDYEDLLEGFPAARRYATPRVGLLGAEQLERACELLGAGWPVAAVAGELDYSCAGAFALAFRRETGMNPGAWKKSKGVKTGRSSRPQLRPRLTWTAADRRKQAKRKKVRRKRGPKQDVI